MNSLVSIIIPTYNRAAYLGETLQSVLQQTWNNWECIIVDDSSTDYTDELMEFYCDRDPRILYFKRPAKREKGANACRNYGFKMSRGEYVNWFDSDDIMHPDFIKGKLKLLKQSDMICSICNHTSFSMKGSDMVFSKKSKVGKEDIFQNIYTKKYAVPTHGPLWKRNYLNEVKLFNENLSVSQDLEFHCRVLPEDSKIVIIKSSLFYLRKGHENITSGFYKDIQQHFDSFFFVRKQIFIRYSSNMIIKKYMRNELSGIFRFLLVVKEYKKAFFLLNYIKENFKPLTYGANLEYLRVYLVFYLVKITGRGETKLKRYLYLSKQTG